MKLAVMGTGGVGGYFGARLAAAGNDVAFIARGPHLEAIRAHGLRIESPEGDLLIRPAKATDRPEEIGPVEVVLFTPKLWDTESAGAAARPLVGPETAVLSLQNGVVAADILAGILGPDHVMGGAAFIAATIAEPGVIRHTGISPGLVFGERDGRRTPRAEALLAACRQAGVKAELSEDIDKAIWQKFVVLVALSGVTSVTRAAIGPIREDRETRALLRDAMAETAAVARAKGVDIGDDFVDDRMAFVDGMVPEVKASMCHDLERGNRLELDWLSGAVARMGRELGVATPVNAFVAAALKLHRGGGPAG